MKNQLENPDMYKDRFADALMNDVVVMGINGASGR